MDTATQVLVVITSSLLAIFLIAGITVAILAAKLIKAVKNIVEQAEKVVDSVEAVGDVFKNASGPLAVLKLISNIVNAVNRRK